MPLASYVIGLPDQLLSTDTITIAFGKIQSQINNFINNPNPPNILIAGTNSAGIIIDASDNIITRLLNNFAIGPNTSILSTDSILDAFGKVQGQLNNKATLIHTHKPSDIINTLPGSYVLGRVNTNASDPSQAITLDNTPSAQSVPFRDLFGRIQVNDPSDDLDAVNLKTVKTLIGQDIVYHFSINTLSPIIYTIPNDATAVVIDSTVGTIANFTLKYPSFLTRYKRIYSYFNCNITNLILNPGININSNNNIILNPRNTCISTDGDEYGYDLATSTWVLLNRHPERDKAPLSSPNFIGAPTAPTAPSITNNTQIATTEFVNTAISNAINNSYAIEYRKSFGNVSTPGSVLNLILYNIKITISYKTSTNSQISIMTVSGTETIDFKRTSFFGTGGGSEATVLDTYLLTTTPLIFDSPAYNDSNETIIFILRDGSNRFWDGKIFMSGSASRANMWAARIF